MADTLKGFTEAMAGFPDNTSGIIKAINARELLLSAQADRGGSYAPSVTTPYVIPIPAVDTWVDIPISLGANMVQSPASLFWRMNGNGHLYYDYAADWPAVSIPAGLMRSVLLLCTITADTNAKRFEFAFTIDGVIQEPTDTIEWGNRTYAGLVTLVASNGISPADAPPVSVQVRNLDDTTDLEVFSFGMTTRGGPLI